MSLGPIAAPPAFLTFDCYGTLVDWEGGIVGAFEAVAAAQDRTVEARQVLELHARIEPEVQAESWRRYRDVLSETALRMAPELGLALDRPGAAFLPDSLPGWRPFPDTNPALRRLAAAGVRLAILSNVDDDLIAGTLRQLDVPFDFIVTAEAIGSYKPAHAHFLAARERIGAASWIHAAQSLFHDIAPARALGIPSVWVDRKAEAAHVAAPPDPIVADMRGLADLLGCPPASNG